MRPCGAPRSRGQALRIAGPTLDRDLAHPGQDRAEQLVLPHRGLRQRPDLPPRHRRDPGRHGVPVAVVVADEQQRPLQRQQLEAGHLQAAPPNNTGSGGDHHAAVRRGDPLDAIRHRRRRLPGPAATKLRVPSWPLGAAGARWVSRPGSSRPSGGSAIRPSRALGHGGEAIRCHRSMTAPPRGRLRDREGRRPPRVHRTFRRCRPSRARSRPFGSTVRLASRHACHPSRKREWPLW